MARKIDYLLVLPNTAGKKELYGSNTCLNFLYYANPLHTYIKLYKSYVYMHVQVCSIVKILQDGKEAFGYGRQRNTVIKEKGRRFPEIDIR